MLFSRFYSNITSFLTPKHYQFSCIFNWMVPHPIDFFNATLFPIISRQYFNIYWVVDMSLYIPNVTEPLRIDSLSLTPQ